MPCRFLVADRSGCSFVWEYSSGGHQSREIVEPDGSGTLVSRKAFGQNRLRRFTGGGGGGDAE